MFINNKNLSLMAIVKNNTVYEFKLHVYTCNLK